MVVKMRESPYAVVPKDHALPLSVPVRFGGDAGISVACAVKIVELVPSHPRKSPDHRVLCPFSLYGFNFHIPESHETPRIAAVPVDSADHFVSVSVHRDP